MAAMAVSESQLKKMVSKVRRGAFAPRRAPTAAFRARVGVARPAQRAGPAESSVRPVSAFAARTQRSRSPRPHPRCAAGLAGAAAARRAGEAACHLPRSAVFGWSLDSSLGQDSVCFRFYKHKEKAGFSSRSGAVLRPGVGVRPRWPFPRRPRRWSFSVCVPRTAQSPPAGEW